MGDMNGDGLSDFIIRYVGSARHTDLYYGSKNPKDLNPAYVFQRRLAYPIGDVNGDGFTDLMTGEPDTANPYSPYPSAIFKLYFGDKELDTVPKFSFKFPDYYFNMVYTLGENIGDINCDGYGDFLVSMPENEHSRVYLYYGGNPLNDKPAKILSGIYVCRIKIISEKMSFEKSIKMTLLK